MICDAAVRHKRASVSESISGATQGRLSRTRDTENQAGLRSLDAGHVSAWTESRNCKSIYEHHLRREVVVFRDVSGRICGSRHLISETQAELCVTDAPQLKTGN